MGIVKKTLASFTLSTGESYEIEYNEDRVIHIHLDNIRIDMSVVEFQQFVDTVLKGRDELRRQKSEI